VRALSERQDPVFCCPSRAPEDTSRLGRLLGSLTLESGYCISLIGPLGAGKSEFARGLASGLGIDGQGVSSPTFTIANQYETASGALLHHVDFYRLEHASELENIGLFDFFGPTSIVAVEWGDRFAGMLPADRLELRIGIVDAERRSCEASATGAESFDQARRWREAIVACEDLELE
jgi:tRNA threonylcarbamoyladenosine biosynthesis protein TsaE